MQQSRTDIPNTCSTMMHHKHRPNSNRAIPTASSNQSIPASSNQFQPPAINSTDQPIRFNMFYSKDSARLSITSTHNVMQQHRIPAMSTAHCCDSYTHVTGHVHIWPHVTGHVEIWSDTYLAQRCVCMCACMYGNMMGGQPWVNIIGFQPWAGMITSASPAPYCYCSQHAANTQVTHT